MPTGKQEAWRSLWHQLESEGWTLEVHKKNGDSKSLQNYFLPPGVKRGPGFKVRVHYFDSRGQVLDYLKRIQANSVPAANESVISTLGGDAEDQVEAPAPQPPAPPSVQVVPEPLASVACDEDLEKVQSERNRKTALQVHLMRSLLEVYSSSTSKAEIESTFAKLEGLGPLSVEMLRETMIGRVLNSLTRRLCCPELQQRARALLASWRCGVRGATGAAPAAAGVPQPALRGKVEALPEGVDPEVWPAIPADCREWAVSSSPVRTRKRISQCTTSQPQVVDLCADAEEEELVLFTRPKQPRNSAAAQTKSDTNDQTKMGANDKTKQDTCIICYARPNTHAFVPCGHQCACGDCGRIIVQGCGAACPICRRRVTMAMQIFG